MLAHVIQSRQIEERMKNKFPTAESKFLCKLLCERFAGKQQIVKQAIWLKFGTYNAPLHIGSCKNILGNNRNIENEMANRVFTIVLLSIVVLELTTSVLQAMAAEDQYTATRRRCNPNDENKDGWEEYKRKNKKIYTDCTTDGNRLVKYMRYFSL